MTRKYPLEPLKRVRAEKVEESMRAVADAVRRDDLARLEAERRERAQEELSRTLARAAAVESERLDKGQQRVADLATEAAFGVSADLQRGKLAREVADARKVRDETRAGVELTRTSLTIAEGESEAVERNFQKWRTVQTAEEIAKDEENAEEVHLSQRKGHRTP